MTIVGVFQLTVLFLEELILHKHTGVCWLHPTIQEKKKTKTKKPVLTVCVFSSCPWLLAGCSQRKPLEDSRGHGRGTSVLTTLDLPSLMWDLSGWLMAMSCGQRMLLLLWKWPSLPALPRWPWRAEGWRLLSSVWSLHTAPEFYLWPTPLGVACL